MYNAGWAVDTVDFGPGGGRELENSSLRLRVGLACRGLGSHLLRVAFQVTAVGVVIPQPP
jgi:hypothetical protein